MPSLSDIATAGPWVVLAFVLIAGFAGFVALILAAKLVPGWIYDRLAQDWRILKDQGDRNSKVMEAVPPLVAVMTRIEAKLDVLLSERDRYSRRDH